DPRPPRLAYSSARTASRTWVTCPALTAVSRAVSVGSVYVDGGRPAAWYAWSSAVRSSRMWIPFTTVLPTLSVASVQPNGASPLTPLKVSIAARRSVTWTALTTVAPGVTVASVKTIENAAVTDSVRFIMSAHVVAGPLQAPPQLAKRVWIPGAAVSVTWVPAVKLAEQVGPQSIPAGVLVTVPPADPRSATASVTGVSVNVALTVVASPIVTTQVPGPLHPPPLQPAKTDPAAAVAVSVTVVPRS